MNNIRGRKPAGLEGDIVDNPGFAETLFAALAAAMVVAFVVAEAVLHS